ncbi:tyrosine-type recombinase/integrase [Comamonas odontotermitis]|uniref:tyrosine-type recombinase/integrase n=1 Tax=Comamonas odontotermitis TaxID=379895 RepID=UPI00295ED15D|nr:integrase arm-type DNA-binding domain-containing protein [Comamonas odontotermitis]
MSLEMAALEVRRLDKPGWYAVGGVAGLGLNVSPTGQGRSWVLRTTINGTRRAIGLGPYPEISLAVAREKAREMREQIRQGIDPIATKRELRRQRMADAIKAVTFGEAAARYIDAHGPSWRNAKHRAQWGSSLAQHAAILTPLNVSHIETAHVVAALQPIWQTRTETASRVRGRIESVLDWATVQGLRAGENPARWRGHLDHLLPAPNKVKRVEHHRALPYAELSAFMQRLKEVSGMGVKALEFAILTAARSGEVRGAVWSEIDFKASAWNVPANRMKAGRPHRVPLSEQAMALLAALPRLDGTDLIFWAPRGGQLSDMTLTAVLRRIGVDATVHGFRSTFRDWAAERTAYPREIAESALAHVNGDRVESAYLRTDHFERRAKLMQEWAKFAHSSKGIVAIAPIQEKVAV